MRDFFKSVAQTVVAAAIVATFATLWSIDKRLTVIETTLKISSVAEARR